MRYAIIIIAILAMACSQTATGPEVDSGARQITYEFTGDVRAVAYAEWMVKPGICQNAMQPELPLVADVEVIGSPLGASFQKYNRSGSVTLSVYEDGIYIGGGTCPDGELSLVWIEQ